ncbi:S49 family peptidase [Cupriavidus basilensis]|uniref:S49 family peptidase n=1 Tax=Cupriavidus basilensis TaxID=68895 RepID=UPI0020A63711|nr:S49 family peptidase [Cupriavidus basilensis]MCP3024963.1 S49 family peptidase [Cupriavidus basilensis]
MFPKNQVWAGTEDALNTALDIQLRFSAATVTELNTLNDGAEGDPPYMFSQHGDVGVISISGPLSNSNSQWARYFGVSTYGAIREALVYAAGLPEVKGILLAINSGGGAVNGVEDTSKLIAQINKSIKPVYTHSDGMMASGAYWLGVNARKLYASSTAIVGSIGVITTHMEQADALKTQGIGVTVIRAGKYKALANPYEKLSDQAKSEIQAQANDIYDIFIGHVAEQRGVTVAIADQKMGQGREFLGSRGAEVGLIDGVKNFEETLALVQRAVEKIDTSKSLINNGKKQEGGLFMPKASLTPQQLAAIEAGASIEAALGTSATPEEIAAAQAAASAGGVDAAAAAAVAAPAAQTDVVAYLQSQLKAKDTELMEVNIKARGLEATIAESQTSFDGLLAIARDSLQKMSIALGANADAAAAMAPTQLLAEHARVSAQFKERFKVGGVAAPAAEADVRPMAAVNSPLVKLAKSAQGK